MSDSYDVFLKANELNKVTIRHYSKVENSVTFDYNNTMRSVDITDFLNQVSRNRMYITNPSALKEYFDSAQGSATQNLNNLDIKGVQDYIRQKTGKFINRYGDILTWKQPTDNRNIARYTVLEKKQGYWIFTSALHNEVTNADANKVVKQSQNTNEVVGLFLQFMFKEA